MNPDEVRVALKDSLEKGYGIHDEEWDQGVLAHCGSRLLGQKNARDGGRHCLRSKTEFLRSTVLKKS